MDGEATYKTAFRLDKTATASPVDLVDVPAVACCRLPSCCRLFGFCGMPNKPAQNGDKLPRPPAVIPPVSTWGMVYILKAFSFSQKGKVHLLNIQTAICHRKCHQRRFLKWGKSSQLRTYTDHNKLHFLI